MIGLPSLHTLDRAQMARIWLAGEATDMRCGFDRLAERVSAAGEPFRLFFTEAQLGVELAEIGFRRMELVNTDRLNQLYFQNRADGLKLSPVGIGMLATAWV